MTSLFGFVVHTRFFAVVPRVPNGRMGMKVPTGRELFIPTTAT